MEHFKDFHSSSCVVVLHVILFFFVHGSTVFLQY